MSAPHPAFARTAGVGPFGKLDDEIDGFRIESITKAEATRLATEEGLTLTEFIRELLRIRTHGLGTVASLHTKRLARVGGMSGEGGGSN